MKYPISIIIILCSFVILNTGCFDDSTPVIDQTIYECNSGIINTHPESSAFQQFLEIQTEKGLPGISMLISSPEGIWSGAAGFADIKNNAPMQSCSQHQIGSITKTFTAVVILKQYELGLIDLDTPISNYLSPSTLVGISNGQGATVRDLLQHSSGIAEFLNLEFTWATMESPDKYWTPNEILSFVEGKDAVFEAGTAMDYSNTNYVLLGLIAENVSGLSIKELYQNFIFNPLGLSSSSFDVDGSIPEGISRGYLDEFANGSLKDITDISEIRGNTSGGMVSNVEDLYHFIIALVKDQNLLEATTVNEMLNMPNLPQFDPDRWIFDADNTAVNQVNGYGLGIIELDTDYGIAYGHNGGYKGRRARMWYLPDHDTSIIFCFNASGEGTIKNISSALFRNDVFELVLD